MPPYNLDIDERDLSEAPRLAKETRSLATVFGIGLLVLLFCAMLAYGSLPALSPQEIIAMEGYAGEQPTKHIFNIHSLDSEGTEATTSAEMASGVKAETSVETAPAQSVSQNTSKPPVDDVATVVAKVEATPVTAKLGKKPEPESVTVVTSSQVSSESTVVLDGDLDQAITVAGSEPAENSRPSVVTFNANTKRKVVAAMATTPKLEESPDTVVIASVVADVPTPMPIKRKDYKHAELARNPAVAAVANSNNTAGKLLPLRTVLEDYTELKSSPSLQAETVLSLGKGVLVTAFERSGKWIHIGTNDGSSITGYVLESQLNGKRQ